MASPSATSTLLLLPPVPFPPTYLSLKAAYHAPLVTLLHSLDNSHSSSALPGRPILDIALPIPLLYKHRDAPRAALFDVTQKALAGLYKLIAIVSAWDGLKVEGDEGLDVRVLLVAWPRDGRLAATDGDFGSAVASIKELAEAKRWHEVVGVECEEGEGIFKAFLGFAGAKLNVRKVRGGIVRVDATREAAFGREGFEDTKRHYSVANGGTFDHLHIGHKLLLSMTAFMLDRLTEDRSEERRYITIGITAEDLLKNKKYAEFLEPWSERQKSVHRFIRGILCFDPPSQEAEDIQERHQPGPNGHVVEAGIGSGISILYTEIWDPFGPTITDEGISALVLSEETRKGGQAVNDKRSEVSFRALDVFEVDVLDAHEEDEGQQPQQAQAEGVEKQFLSKLSSTAIRKARSERTASRSKA